jgi:predicted  nucleic acid-binding Zn-ribbon protein
MPEHEQFADLQQKLEQLNRLEDEGAMTRRSGNSALDSEALLESLRASVPLNVLVQHDRLRARGRQSVAQVKHGVCSGCHMSLPSGTLSETKRRSTIVKCDYCGRFIFVAAEELVSEPPVAMPKESQSSRRPTKP